MSGNTVCFLICSYFARPAFVVRTTSSKIATTFGCLVWPADHAGVVAGLTFGDCGQWWAASSETRQQCDRKAYTGVALSAVGAIGMITGSYKSGQLPGEANSLPDYLKQSLTFP